MTGNYLFSIVDLEKGLVKRNPDYPMIIFAGLGTIFTVLPIFVISEIVCLAGTIVFALIFSIALISSLIRRKSASSTLLLSVAATLLMLLPSIVKVTNSLATSYKLSEIPYLFEDKMPNFSGTYYYGDGLGFNNKLDLQDHACSWSSIGCTGTSLAYAGTYKYQQGYLVLTADYQPNHFFH